MDVKKAVRDNYGQIARKGSCGSCGTATAKELQSQRLGYEASALDAIPDEADLGLGCGNPTAFAGLQPGEVVLDLGSGGGIDCFLAASAVGPTGRAIGVDMTPEMVERARAAAARGGYENVEFRLGELENLPVADASVGVIISNCVINLVPDKRRAFAEAFRVLRPGGRMHVSDIVIDGDLPEDIRGSVAAYVGCVAGALTRTDYLAAIEAAGFTDIRVDSERDATELLNSSCCSDGPDSGCCGSELPRGIVMSITLSARKPD
jgi:arsenite methyltransferase